MPEYNSEDDDTDTELNDDNNQSTKPTESNKIASLNDAPMTSPIDENKTMPFTKTMSSFASIIVGGRSPNQDTQNLVPSDTDATDSTTITTDLMAIEREHPSQKQFKRKRRIEYSTNPKRGTNQPDSSAGGDASNISEEICENNSSEMSVFANKLTVGNLYENFQRESGESQTKNERKSAESEPIGDLRQTNGEISQLKDTLEAKLQFLCQGQTEVELKPVQIMNIQLQVRLV